MPNASYRCAVVGSGRAGSAFHAALTRAGWPVEGPCGRGADPAGVDLVLLCVPDREIAAAAAAITPRAGLLVGHCSGATTLAPLVPHEAFSLHPLMTIAPGDTDLHGVAAATAAGSDRAQVAVDALAQVLGMRPFTVSDEDRAAYHAAASVASNFLITLLDNAERIGGVERAQLAGLVRATVDNWESLGPERALTGPIARGDEETVARQRAAVADSCPDALALFDVMADRTRDLAGRTVIA